MDLQHVIREIVKIPPTPQVLPKLQRLLRQPDSDPSDIVKVLKVDVSITAQVLKFANSSYFGLAAPVQGLDEAVYIMGFREIFKIVSVAAAKDVLAGALAFYNTREGEVLENSIAAAQIMTAVSEANGMGGLESYYTTGLLHAIGMIVINQYFHNRGLSAFGGHEGLEGPLEEASLEEERALFGFDHAEAGAALLESWKFSEEIAIPIRYQYSPESSPSYRTITNCLKFSRETAVQVVASKGQPAEWNLEESACERVGLAAESAREALNRACAAYAEVKEMLKV